MSGNYHAQLKSMYFKTHCIEDIDSGHLIYRAKNTIAQTDHENKLRRVEIGLSTDKVEQKVILAVGQTGSGKTSFINSLYNYIMDITYDSPFKMKLVDERVRKSQAHSQTQWITAYTIHHQPWFNIPFTLTVIDTPGFGDTEGIARDKEILDQLWNFFTSAKKFQIDHIDMVGFVAKSCDARLSKTEEYVLESVAGLFGKDIRENICMLLTFADGSEPPILESLGEFGIQYRTYFKFNNASIFDSSKGVKSVDDDDDIMSQVLWQMTFKVFGRIMQEMSKVEPQTLNLSKEVLAARRTLDKKAARVKKHITKIVHNLGQLQIEKSALKQHTNELEKKKPFKFKVPVRKTQPCPTNKWTTNCTACEETCCEDCLMYFNRFKFLCECIKGVSNCRECGCSWKHHKNQQFAYKVYYEEVEKTDEDLIKKYVDKMQDVISVENMIKVCEAEIQEDRDKAISEIKEGFACHKRLREIALRSKRVTINNYIDHLMAIEKMEGMKWAEDRVKQLQEFKSDAEIISVMEKGDKMTEESLLREISLTVEKQIELEKAGVPEGAKTKMTGFLKDLRRK